MSLIRIMVVLLIGGLALASRPATAQTLATFEFTSGSLAPTLGSLATSNGITVGNLSTFSAPAAVSIADLASDPNALRLPGDLTANGTGDALAGGQYLSFDVTIPSTATINLTALSADISGTSTFNNSATRLFSSLHGSPGSFDVVADTIGANFDAHPSIPVTTLSNDLSDPANNISNGVNVSAGDFDSLSDTTITFYMPWFDSSSSVTRWATMDNLTLTGEPVGSPELALTVDRASGEVTLGNPGSLGGQDFIGYSITSASGGLNESTWTSIADSYDVNGSSATQISVDDWSKLTAAGANGDLSEFDFASSAGATMPASTSVSLGVGSWIPTDTEDLQFLYVLANGEQVQGDVSFIGNGDVPFDEGDIDTDGDIDSDDWIVFRTNLGGTFDDDSQAQAYRRGDFDGDLDVDGLDFIAFRGLYETANPGLSFAGMVAATAAPEPAGCGLLLMGWGAVLLARKRISHCAAQFVAIVFAAATASSVGVTYAQVETFDSFTVGAAFTGGAVSGTTGTELANAGWTFFDYAADGATANNTDTVWTIEDETGAGGTRALAQTNTNPDFLGGLASMGGIPIGGAIAYTNQFDTSDPIMVYEWDFRFGGVALEGPGNTFADIKLLFGTQSELEFFSIDLVAGNPTTGDRSQLSISQTIPDGGDGAPVRLRPFNELPALEAGFPENTPLRARVTHDANEGAISLSITNLTDSSVITERSVIDSAFESIGGSVGIGTNNDAFSLDRLSATALPRLTLQVDPVDGDIQIANDSGEAIAIDLYQIDSLLGELNDVGWNSLESQDLAGFPAGDGTGNGWEAGDASDSEKLIEAFLTGNSSVADATTLYLGKAVISGVTQADNLSWQYHEADAGAELVTGKLEFIAIDSPAGLAGDYNNDGTVDAVDYAVWRENLGQSVTLPNDDTPGTVDQSDYVTWRNNYGNSSAPQGGATVAPEPHAAWLLGLLAVAGAITLRHRAEASWSLSPVKAIALAACYALLAVGQSDAAVTIDRFYSLGDYSSVDGYEGQSLANGPAGTDAVSTFGTAAVDEFLDNNFADMSSISGVDLPVYYQISPTDIANGHPGSIGKYALQFNGDDAISSTKTLDSVGLSAATPLAQGVQMWVMPSSAGLALNAPQTILADTNNFGGPAINADGNWTMISGGSIATIPGAVAADADVWSHVAMHNYLSGDAGNPNDDDDWTSVLYVNGIAVAANNDVSEETPVGTYVLGADDVSGAPGRFFNGVVDQIQGYLVDPEASDDFNLLVDNDYIAKFIDDSYVAAGKTTGTPYEPGDINLDGDVDADDVTAFVAGWLMEKELADTNETDLLPRVEPVSKL